MRQGLFAVLLILAAFAGGALMNGPGLAWARQQLAKVNAPGTAATDVPIAEVEPLSPEVATEHQDGTLPPLPVANASPFAPAMRDGGETGEAEDDPPSDSPPEVRAPRGPSIASSTSKPAPDDDRTPPPSSPAAAQEPPKPPPSLFDAARLRMPDRPIARVSDQSTAAQAPTIGNPEEEADPSPPDRSSSAVPPSEWSDSPDSTAPARPFLPDPEAPASTGRDDGIRRASTPDNPPDEAGWASVRRRMEELGVGRYWVEGAFGGPVVFRCVVPVVGDRAVSQHFEAEGDDLLTAAGDALRRIALWRATEPTP